MKKQPNMSVAFDLGSYAEDVYEGIDTISYIKKFFENEEEIKYFLFYTGLFLSLIFGFIHCVNQDYWLGAGLIFILILFGTIQLIKDGMTAGALKLFY